MQECFARVVHATVGFSWNPLWLTELGARYIQLKTYWDVNPAFKREIDSLRAEIKELKKRGRAYDENFYRRPIGIGVFLSLILLFTLAIIYFKI